MSFIAFILSYLTVINQEDRGIPKAVEAAKFYRAGPTASPLKYLPSAASILLGSKIWSVFVH